MSRSSTHEAVSAALTTRVPAGLLQRKCACGPRPAAGGDCESCRKENDPPHLQRAATRGGPVNEVPPVVHDVLRSPGQPLDPASRAFFEAGFGHDFSGVRIHRDARAAESALAVNALAYTVGNDVVFDAGRYAPDTREGRKLLAHELTHVVQQRDAAHHVAGRLKVGGPDDASERAADAAAQAIAAGGQAEAAPASQSGVLRRQSLPSDLFKTGTDAMHRQRVKDYRRQAGYPESGRDEYGDPAGPSDAQITYELSSPYEDPSRMLIDAVPDFLASSLTAPRQVGVHINDSLVASLHWVLLNPAGRVIASTPTTAGQANATAQPFNLEPSQFSGPDFVEGQHILYCYGEDSNQHSFVYARRDFNVLSSQMKRGKALDTAYGQLTFTRYDPLDADLTDAHPHYEVFVILEFLPKGKVACDDVSFIQAAQNLDPTGQSRASNVHADIAARQTKLSWAIDQGLGGRSPYYDVSPQKGPNTDAPRSSYPGKGGAKPSKARLFDEPGGESFVGGQSLPPTVMRFETCAVCRSGKNIGQVYGCATWGFSADDHWRVKLMPPAFRQMPSDTFLAAAAEWNVWGGKQPAAQRADVLPELKSP